MKFVVIWEYVKGIDEITPKSDKLNEDRAKNPEKYPKILLPNHIIMDTSPKGKFKGFAVVEADSTEQMANWIKGSYEHWSVKYLPIMDAPKFREIWGM